MKTQEPAPQIIFGITLRQTEQAGGELRAFTVLARDVDDALARGGRMIESAGLRDSVTSIHAKRLGIESTNECVERHNRWVLGVISQAGIFVDLRTVEAF